MKTEKLKPQNLEQVALDWGIDYQVFKIKNDLINTIKRYCEEHEISQRKLAAMVEGLSQDK
jgi:predicted XRE-type DNA-binding protein